VSDDRPEARVRVFGTPTCPHCRATRAWLSERGVDFADLDVTTDAVALRTMIWTTGLARVPVVLVGRRALVGFDPAALEALITAPDEVTGWEVPPSVVELAKAGELDGAQPSSPAPGHEEPGGERNVEEPEDR
jgi:glutaredoxin 3